MTDRPLMRLRWGEDTRIRNFKQTLTIRAVVVWIFLITGFLASCPGAAYAETPPTAAVAIVPADGNARGVQLRAQAVDIVIRQEADGVWADTSLWTQLHNPGRTAIAVPVTLTGLQPDAVDLPAGLTLTLGKTQLALQPLPPRDDQPRVAPTEPITVPLRGSVTLRLRYRQAVPVTSDVATVLYPLTATARWPGTPESLRVTIRFATPVAQEQILAYESLPKRQGPDSLTWDWEYKKAAQDVGIAFVTSAWWAALTADRAAAAAGDAGPAQHLALARRYQALLDLPPSPLAQATDPFERYYPAAVAELRAALRQAPPGDPASAAAHVELAALYRLRGERAGGEAAQPFLQLAAVELAAAASSADPAVAAAAADLYGELAAAASARGDAITAGQHRARQAALQATGALASADALAQAAALTDAVRAAQAGDLAAARTLVAAAFGPAAATLPDAPPPLIGHARATVDSRPGQRIITLQLGVDGDAAALAALLQETAAALRCVSVLGREHPERVGGPTYLTNSDQSKDAAWRDNRSAPFDFGLRPSAQGAPLPSAPNIKCTPALRPLAQVEVEANTLVITLTGAPATWLATQAQLAAALPPAPELALLADTLRPRALAWESTAETFRFSERYVESIELTPARAAWEAQAARIEALAAAHAGATAGLPGWLDAEARSRLADVQRALWQADAAAWRALADGSGAAYRVTLALGGEERRWAVPAGTARELVASAAAWREDRLAWAAAGAALGVVLLALAVWLAVR